MFNVNVLTINNVICNLLDTLRICFPELRFGIRQRRNAENATQTYLVAFERAGEKRGFQLPLRLYTYFRKMREQYPEADLDDIEADLYARIATKIEKYFSQHTTPSKPDISVAVNTAAVAAPKEEICVVVDNTAANALLVAN